MEDLTGMGTAVKGVKDILGMFFPDKTEEEKAKMVQAFQLAQLQADANRGQMAVNEKSEANGFTFRDGAGWVCTVGLAVTVLRPLVSWGAIMAGHPVNLPALDTSETTPMLLSLLGLGGMHMNEVIKRS